MSVLICGSIAFDNIMVFQGRFREHILPEQIHILNVAFLVPEMRREFGGCAGNIAYNLKMLAARPDEEPLIMATVGQDSASYFERLKKLHLDATHVKLVPDSFTAQAFITTDLDDNQITAFHPGAMDSSHTNHVGSAANVKLGIVAPDGRAGMFQHAREFAAAGIPFVFDPGQGLPMFNGPELLEFIDLADYAAFNDYEAKLVQEKTGETIERLASRVKGLVVTRGAEGSFIYANGQRHEIPCVKPESIADPTGCGDAYRAGLLYGIVNGLEWQQTGQLASIMGSMKIARRGAQNHRMTRDEIGVFYRQQFGAAIW
jgi:adenosine kinase